jgi:hypothetical protein
MLRQTSGSNRTLDLLNPCNSLYNFALPFVGLGLPRVVCRPQEVGDHLQPEARASFLVAPDGTRMNVRLGYPRWLAILHVLNLAYIVLFLVGMGFLCRYMKLQHCDRMFVFAIAFPLFLTVGPLLFPRRFREQSEFLLAFLKQTLEAEEVPPRSLHVR